MGLDLRKITKVRRLGDGSIVARCPACAEAGQDRDGNHLVIYPDGRFGCVVFPGEAGVLHRKAIWAKAGKNGERKPAPVIRFTVRAK
jgi:hypothetical protein